jgi:hypothetical protein
MLRIWMIAALVVLAGCKPQAERDRDDAVADYRYIKDRGGTGRELCAAAQRVVDAQVRARAEELDYLTAQINRTHDCL